jgi:hypothetical protein
VISDTRQTLNPLIVRASDYPVFIRRVNNPCRSVVPAHSLYKEHLIQYTNVITTPKAAPVLKMSLNKKVSLI